MIKQLLSLAAICLSLGVTAADKEPKPKLMWFDCSANYERLSHPDSIRYYVRRCKEAGITAIVLDIKGTASAVVYPSRYAPQLKEWKGVVRPDFDFVGLFVQQAHALGMQLYGSFNTFAEGSGIFRRGLIYDGHPEWQAINYLPGKGLVPQLEIEGKQVLFVNPLLDEVQRHEIALLEEFATSYPIDGVILDRARYDNIQSDFSPASRHAFEAYIGQRVERFPEDIYEWRAGADGQWHRAEGRWFKQWIEWRASVIFGFFKRAKEALKAVAPKVLFGAYTGAWYPSYYEVGVNWADPSYDPSQEYAWATPEYRNYGYAGLLDIYTNGNYYRRVTIEEYRASNGLHRNETDSELSKGEHLCVEGGCRYSRRLLGKNRFFGGLYVEDYQRDSLQFQRAVEMNLRESDGLMIFDVVHIIQRNWWDELKHAIDRSGE